MQAFGIDPVLHLALRSALALLFFWAAFHKLRDVEGFRSALRGYELLPDRWIGRAATLFVAVEVGVAAGFCVPERGAAAAGAASGLLALYAAAIAINLRRGRHDVNCGCTAAAHQPLSAALVARNLVLIGAALVTALPVATRELTAIDGFTIGASVLTVAMLYAAIDGLLARKDTTGWTSFEAESKHA